MAIDRDLLFTENDALAALAKQKEQLKGEIQTSKKKMYDIMCEMTAPLPKTTNRIQSVSQLVSNAMAIYEGMRIGIGIITAIKGTFRRTKNHL